MANVEKTRSNIRVGELDDQERKELFGKFVSGGGKVITERDERAAKLKASEDKIKLLRKRLDDRIEAHKKNVEAGTPDDTKKKTDSRPPVHEGGLFSRMMLKLSLYFEGLFSGVTDSSGRIINRGFLRFIDGTLLTDLLEAEALITATISPIDASKELTAAKQARMRAHFDKTFKFEILERFRDIYDEEQFALLLAEYKILKGNTTVTVFRKRDAILALFKRMYILHNSLSSLRDAVVESLQEFARIENMDRLVVNQRHTVIRRAIDSVYYKFFPKLFVLVKIIAERNFSIDDRELAAYIGMHEEDVIGWRTAEMKREEAEAALAKENAREEEKKAAGTSDIDQYAKVGIGLIEKLISFSKDDNGVKDESHKLFFLNHRDKIYRAKLILDFFDREYSLALTTNKIKFNIILTTANKTDYGTMFSNSLSTLSDVNRRIDDYVKVVQEIAKIDGDREMQFTHRAMLTQTKEATRSRFAKSARTSILQFVREVKENLGKLLLDRTTRESVLANPGEKLIFDTLIHGDKRFNGYSALEALTETYYFICGFHYLLTEGSLSGLGLLIDDDVAEAEEKKKPQPETAAAGAVGGADLLARLNSLPKSGDASAVSKGASIDDAAAQIKVKDIHFEYDDTIEIEKDDTPQNDADDKKKAP
ncbi:MAG: hypothetical protein HZC28_18850 [Spirochaetes bacterium]|nr:hypothetical protein [Spirochaetota bacterium]